MRIVRKIHELKSILGMTRLESRSIGLVPTMGALHAGHLSLLKKSLATSDITVCSVFVNPTQFNNPSDLANYPQQEQQDFDLLSANGCDIVFAPSVEEMYGVGQDNIKISFGRTEEVLEGAFRPGHFSGVGVVVAKLLNIVSPDQAYFGQKDLQQVAIIKQLVSALNFNCEVVVCPTMREPHGLAMSSRNLRLSASEKKVALNLYLIMKDISKNILRGVDIGSAFLEGKRQLSEIDGIDLEYLELVNGFSMQSVTDLAGSQAIYICGAAQVGQVRIIDNLCVKEKN